MTTLAFFAFLPIAAAEDSDRSVADSTAALPDVSVTLAPDGAYTLVIVPPVAWRAAEVSVAGGGSVDVGPASPDAPARIEGWLDSPASTIGLSVCAATAERAGTCWMFQVEPIAVPVAAPETERVAPEPRGWLRRFWL